MLISTCVRCNVDYDTGDGSSHSSHMDDDYYDAFPEDYGGGGGIHGGLGGGGAGARRAVFQVRE